MDAIVRFELDAQITTISLKTSCLNNYNVVVVSVCVCVCVGVFN